MSSTFLVVISLSVVAFSSFVGKHFLDILSGLRGSGSQVSTAVSGDEHRPGGDVAGSYTSVDETQIPGGFPDDFPIYPGSSLVDYWFNEEDGFDSYSLVWETDKSFDEVSSYYREVFSYLEWEYEIVLDAQDSFTLSFTNGNLSGFLGLGDDISSGKVIVSVTLGVNNQ